MRCCCPCVQSGLTSLHLAAQEDRVGVAEILAKHGANLDQQTKVWTALHFVRITFLNFMVTIIIST